MDSVIAFNKEDAMSCRLLTVALLGLGIAFATESYAAKNLNTSRSNIYRDGTPKGATGPAATPTTVKGSKSNSSDRMGGGGGGKGATGLTSGRMGGGGGGKGAVR
jgi:hypothetical protein